MLVRRIVVKDDVERQFLGKLLVQSAQELQKVLMPMPAVTFSDYRSIQEVECGKQGCLMSDN